MRVRENKRLIINYFNFERLLVFSLFLITFFSFSLAANALDTNYYVAKTGLDSNPGTEARPFLTINKGASILGPGDTLFVKAGTYNELVWLVNSGTINKPITIKNFGSDQVILDRANAGVWCMYGDAVSNYIIEGLTMKNGTAYNLKFQNSSNIIVRNSTFELPIDPNSTVENIMLSTAAPNWNRNITLENLTAVGGDYGILIGGGNDGINIIGGRYSNARYDGITFSAGINSYDTTRYIRNVVIDGTETDHNSRQGIVSFGGIIDFTLKNFWTHDNGASGVQIENYSKNIVIEDFIAENNARSSGYETGIWIDDSSDVIVRRGIMRNNETGFRVSASKNVLAYDLLIYNNDYFYQGAVNNNSSGISFYSRPYDAVKDNNLYEATVELYNSVIYSNSNPISQRGSAVFEGSGTYTLKNNIFVNDKSTRDIYRTGTNIVISDNNIFYSPQAFNAYYGPDYPTTNPTNKTWSAYKTATGLDANSINANPLFINAVAGDFKLQAGSPAINEGVSVGLTADYLKNAIVGLPDIGAYESNYTSTPPTTTTYTLTLTKAGTGSGAVTGSGTYNSGTSVTATATPSAGSSFTSWSGDCNSGGVVIISANKSCTATFTLNTYSITISSTNGTVTKSPNKSVYSYGETVSLSASPSSGYTFSSWGIDVEGTTNPVSVLINTNKIIAATFTLNTPSTATPATTTIPTVPVTPNPGNSGGGGGGGATNYCNSVSYSPWSDCTNKQQFRLILSKTPSTCTLTLSQQLELSRVCEIDPTPILPLVNSEASSTKPITTTVGGSNSTSSLSTTQITKLVTSEKQLSTKIDLALSKRLAGKILLQVEQKGEAWYLDLKSLKRYYLADGETAYNALRQFGLGIKNTDLNQIPVGLESRFTMTDSDSDGLPDKLEEALGTNPSKTDSDSDGYNDGVEIKSGYSPTGTNKLVYSSSLIKKLSGRIVIQTESRGEAWYINPTDSKRYYLASGEAAYQIMRYLSLGIKDLDIRKIGVGSLK